MSESQPSWIGHQIGNRYQIESLLGRGGMSSVYKAIDPNLQRNVAVKIIHPHLSEHPEFVKRFEQEAAAVAQLRHPNIIQVHDFNHHGDVYYMILEYLQGDMLETRLSQLKDAGQKLPISETVRIMTKLCDAVAYAHESNMIHRDLKPSNVMLNPSEEPILMDFGIAKIVGSEHVHTATGATIGTAAYMAPEQVKGEEVDRRADIYSLGVILFEMVSGRPPYEGRSALTVMMKHLEEPIPDIRILNLDVPDILVGILEKALAKDPLDRFSSAKEMADSLRKIGQPTTQHPAQQPVAKQQTAVSPAPSLSEIPDPAPEKQSSESTPTTNRKPIFLIGTAVFLISLITAGFILWPRFFPTIPTSATMVNIPAGNYTVGTDSGGNQTAATQQIQLEAYWIDQFEVTQIEFATFVEQTNAEQPTSWTNGTPPSGNKAHPVQGVSWETADAYCGWVGKRLPTEAEWEVAARGTNGLLYPWGNDRQLVSLPSNETYASGSMAINRSAFNVYDLASNVWEWVDVPYTAVSSDQRVLRGGSYDNQRDLTYRLIGDPNLPTMQATAGFRCAATEVEIVPQDDILLEDEFDNPESGWESRDEGSILYGYHPPDFYHVQASNTDTLSTSFFGANSDTITMESLVFVDATDTESGDFRYGMVLRRDGESFYAFTISPRANAWYVLKNNSEGLSILDQGAIEGLNGLVGKDRLRVDASGADFAFSINGRLVSQLTDSELREGDIGFLVQTFDETRAHVHYDRLTIREVAYQPTTTILQSDDFTNPESGWPSLSEGSVLSGYHPPDFYHVQSGEPEHRSLAVFDGTIDDFTVETDVFVDSTDTPDGDFYYGLIARKVEDDYYAFLISPQTGVWRVIKNSSESSELLAEGNEASLGDLTAVKRLRVDAEGNNLIFQVNGKPLVLVNDSSYTEGDVGFIVETVDQPRAHIHYDTFTLRKVDADLENAPIVAEAPIEPTVEPTPQPTATSIPEPTPEPTVEPTAEPVSNLPSNLDMAFVDGGTYSVDDDTAVALEPFWIDQYEITNNQFGEYLSEKGADSTVILGEANHPVKGIGWDEADAYCQWANKRLPTEAEWVIVARGPNGWLYPWGNDETAVSLPTSGTYPVGSIPTNRTVFGVFDMAGNVWEWVDAPYLPVGEGQQVLRGGANSFQQDLSQRLPGDPTSTVMITNAGFRCAASEVEQTGEADSDTVLLTDDFANVDSGWWQAREPVDAFFYGYHPSDFYHMQISATNDCLSVNSNLIAGNFMAEVEIFTARTDTETGQYRYGFTIRQTDDAYYAFEVNPRSQSWQIFKSSTQGLAIMAEGENDSIRGDSRENRDTLFVIANGPQLSFFVNGTLVSTVVDTDYQTGRFGFIIHTLDETYTHVHFDSVKVWSLPDVVEQPNDVEATAVAPVSESLCRGSVVEGNTLVSFITHTVVSNESISSIAEQYDLTPEEIFGANGRTVDDPNLIQPGQKLIIPQN